MTPITPVFPSRGLNAEGRAIVFAEHQPQYQALPAVLLDGRVTTRWRLTWRERITLLFHGNLWLQLLTFNQPLQPVKLMVEEPAASSTSEA